jgi:2-isopropylmalate synthase
MKARELGFDVTNATPQLRQMLARIKDLEHQGYEFESADGSIAILLHRSLTAARPPFVVEAYHVSLRREGESSTCEAVVKVRVGDQSEHRVAEGDGPVNALDAALRSALGRYYRQLHDVHLTDYKVRIIDSTKGTAARTRVLIASSDGRSEWGTVGVDDNIVEASLKALVDSLEYALVRDKIGIAAT